MRSRMQSLHPIKPDSCVDDRELQIMSEEPGKVLAVFSCKRTANKQQLFLIKTAAEVGFDFQGS